MIGIALDPVFSLNGFVYLHYTATTPTIHNRVNRFTANGDVAVPRSGGWSPHRTRNAVGSNAQSLSSPVGKNLRIAPDGTIPASNPFFGATSGINRAIWALGLRNPFTFTFEPGSGRMLINDVGQNTWEEIDEGDDRKH